jgi:paraquat-inducible protein B
VADTDPQPAAENAAGGRPEDGETLPEARVVRRERFSLVWLLPLIALAVGGWLAWKTLAEQGPTITIAFKTASGLEAGKTKVKFKDVEVGQVTGIDLAKDLDNVIVTAQLKYGAERYLTEKTRFWVARPRVTASRVSGLETLLSGAYVAIDPVTKGRSARHFVGLPEPPVITTDEPGTHFKLRSQTLGSLNLGSPVYYRHIPVGQVVHHELDEDGEAVTIEIFITKPHDSLVYSDTRFWNTSGIDVRFGADGIQVNTESLLSVLVGGIAFDTLETLDSRGAKAKAGQFFQLYQSREQAHERVYLDRERYLLVFNGSVRGLSIGAPVLLRGIQIGKVLDIELRFDPDRLDFEIPVLIEVEPERIEVSDEQRRRLLREEPDLLKRLVEAGLRGQLKTGSLLTGQLYVELDFFKDAQPAQLAMREGRRVLPTVPAPLEAATGRISSILAKIDQFPIEQIGTDLTETLASLRALVDSDALKGSLTELEQALTRISSVAGQLDQGVVPELEQTLAAARLALANISGVIGPEAPLSVELTRTMRDVSAAARSIRVFADYLDRHPEALIRGKGAR